MFLLTLFLTNMYAYTAAIDKYHRVQRKSFSGKLKLAFTSLDVISLFDSRILLFEFLKKHHLAVGQVKIRIH